jgi:superfamily II DNA or RNA helicase
MDQGLVTDLKINAVILNHPDDDKRVVSKMKYDEELKVIIQNKKRNKFICNLAISQKHNTLILFNYVDKHGKVLLELFKSITHDKLVYFISGDTPVQEREEIRRLTEQNNNVIILASAGTFSTGINVKNLSNVIFAHPYKSKIKNLQSIGRVLRKGGSDQSILYDIADDYSWRSKDNTTLKHLKERLKIYEKEQFNYKVRILNV